MKKSVLKDIVKFLIFFSIGVLLIYLFVRKLSPEEITGIKTSLKDVKFLWLFVALFIGALSNVARTSRWRLIMEPLGYKPKYSNVFLAVLVTYFANLAVPRLGEVSRCGILAKYENIPFEKSLGTVLTERTTDLLVFFLLFLINIICQFGRIKDYLNDNVLNKLPSISSLKHLIIIAVGLCFLVATLLMIFFYLKKCKPGNKFVVKLNNILTGFWDGLKSLFYMKKPLLFIFHTLLLWVCYFFMTYFVFFALKETSFLGAGAAISSMLFSTIGVILIQGGIGIYPIIVAEVLLMYGLPSAIGYTSGWLIWLNQTAMVIFGGIVALILIPLLNKSHESIKST